MIDFLDRISKLPPQKLALLVKELQERLESLEKDKRESIAIVGMGLRVAGADGVKLQVVIFGFAIKRYEKLHARIQMHHIIRLRKPNQQILLRNKKL